MPGRRVGGGRIGSRLVGASGAGAGSRDDAGATRESGGGDEVGFGGERDREREMLRSMTTGPELRRFIVIGDALSRHRERKCGNGPTRGGDRGFERILGES
jgi:hypothetical protein